MSDPRNAYKRAWEREPAQRKRCAVCGVLCGPASRLQAKTPWCAAHEMLFRRLRVSARRAVITQRYLRGESYAVIAERLGTTTNHIGVEMAKMRNAGVDLPPRRAAYRRVASS